MSGQRNAKIVCTLGPATDDLESINRLADAGMAVARVNASHGSLDARRELLERVGEVADDRAPPLARLLDCPGGEVRTAPVESAQRLDRGDEIRFVVGEASADDEVGVTHSLAAAQPGDSVLLDEGRVETTVQRTDGEDVVARVDVGGTLREGRRHVNVPGVDLGLPAITEADRRNLELAAAVGVEFVAISHVRDGDAVYAVSEVLESHDADIPVVAKVERAAAVDNLASIVEAASGVMVARGDLGVECPLEEVPLIQKRIVRRCHGAGVPVITATEMLDSMVHEPRPTRAEASDVANAVLDGTDAVMLSAETAVGDHPVRTVETMANIVDDTVESGEFAELREQRVPAAGEARTDALARSARYLARDVDAAAVVVATESGYTARKVAKFRPAVPVVAVTPDRTVARQLALSWGVHPTHAELPADSVDAVIGRSVEAALDTRFADSGDTVVALSGMMTDLEGTDTANTLKVHVAATTLASGRGVVPGRAGGPVFRTVDGDVSNAPQGAVLVLDAAFDGTLTGDFSRLGAVVHGLANTTSYPAQVARELGVPMVGGVGLEIPDGATVTVDGERGVVYEGSVPEG